MIGRVRLRAAHEPVVAVAQVQHGAVVHRVNVIDRDLPRHELEPLAGGEVVEVVVVVAVAIVPADPRVHPLPIGDVLIDADGVVRVLDVLGQRRLLEVVGAVRVARRGRPAEVLERGARHRVDQALRNDVAGERILLEAPVADGAARERVIDLVLRAERQQLREVAGAHPLGRHGRRAVVARPRLVDHLEAVHEEGLVPAVVAGQHHRTAGPRARPVVVEVRQRNVVGVGEEVVGEELLRRLGDVGRAAQLVRAGLDREVDDAAFGVAGGRVERRGLDLELLDDPRGRHVGGDDLVGVGGRGARDAVDRQVVAVAARAGHRVADDVRRLERTIETGRPGGGDARGQADERVGIAVRRRQLRDPPRVDDVAERRGRGLEQRRVGGDGDGFGDAGLEPEIDLEPIGDAQLDVPRHFLEPRQLRGDAIGAGQQERDLEEALLVGHDGDGRAHGGVGDAEGGAGDDAAARVAYGAGDRAAGVLGGRGRGEQSGQRQAGERARKPNHRLSSSVVHEMPLMAGRGPGPAKYKIYDCGITRGFLASMWAAHLATVSACAAKAIRILYGEIPITDMLVVASRRRE